MSNPEQGTTMRLKDKTAIITGAGSGMGRAMALLFAREGARIAVADLNEASALETAAMITNDGGRARALQCDVADSAGVKHMVDATASSLGPATVLVNNAGITSGSPKKALCDISEEFFDRMIAVNLRGVWLGMKHAIPYMIEAGGGSIVNIASIAGLVVCNSAEYSASKAGVLALTRVAAFDYGPNGIRVNAICPGATQTPMAASQQKTQGVGSPSNDPRRLGRMTVLGRFGRPEEIAKAALFLASDDSSYATGATFVIDGGWTVISSEGTSRSPL
jgi:NAD(P)-dependent dehydrogenase (short-subunit alcohol dehydrogenase family)